MNIKVASFSQRFFDNLIVLLFAILPLVDSLNGVLVRQGVGSIGSVYKVCLCAVLLLPVLRQRDVRVKTAVPVLVALGYILTSVAVNYFVLNAPNLKLDHAVKLVFNIVTFALLLENHSNGTLRSTSFYRMLDICAWLLPVCYFVPYVLGTGYHVYSGNMGYKAFFIAQNELSLIIIVLFYFCLYKLTLKLRLSTLAQAALILLCGLLLNTKSTILACLLGAAVCFLYVLVKLPTRIRIYALGILAVGCLVFVDVIAKVVSSMVSRFSTLQNKYYSGSVLTAILSGRDYLLADAWNAFSQEHTILRLLLGNGFCSGYLVEMDILDMFFYLGIPGALSAVIFLVAIFVKSRRNLRTDPSCIRLLSFLLIVFFLNITGHVLFMAMSGCYFVVYMAFLMTFASPTGAEATSGTETHYNR